MERTSAMTSFGPGMNNCFSVARRSCPEPVSRTRTACSSSTCTPFFLPPSRERSLGPRKTLSTPRTTRTSPVLWSSIFTYSSTFKSIALSLSPSRSSSSAPGKTIFSPRCTVTLPDTLSNRRTYSNDFNVQAFCSARSMRHVGSRKRSAFPRCTQRCPVASSLILTNSSSCSATASRTVEHFSFGSLGNHTQGPFRMLFIPVSWFSTVMY
mmetsp:Transcript_35748/g.95008  ORF Transcript_35748/g.95008 Transcript_35748/m.95008 type:complete len:210 (+) Transcript_35748:1073-1702(+)